MKKISVVLITGLLVLGLASCATGSNTISEQSNLSTSSAVVPDATVTSTSAQTLEQAQAENYGLKKNTADYVWDSAGVIPITLNGESISADAAGVKVEGSVATIISAGTYSLTGSNPDGQIVVDTQDEEVVRLILSNVNLRSSTSAPINIVNAERVVIVLADGTDNTIGDATDYVFASDDEDEPNAAIFSKTDLVFWGNGSLTVDGNYNDGITSKDGLIIASGTINVNAVDDGIRGKDYLVIEGGNITVNAGGDGLKSDNENDVTKGYISIASGVFSIASGGDAIAAQSDVLITEGEFTLVTAGGSDANIVESISAKGIKGNTSVIIDGGRFNINAADDGVHSNGSVTINQGSFNIASGDDGMHADSMLTINNGIVHIEQSYEGLESAVITINDGEIQITSTDDGINISGGMDGSGMQGRIPGGGPIGTPGGGTGGGPGGGTGGTPGGGTGGGPGGWPGGKPGGGTGGQQGPIQDSFTPDTDYYLYIRGGMIVVNAGGDGLDVNGAIEMSGGTVLVHGPVENMNGALDYDASFTLTGGVLIAAGSAGMAMAPGATSSQNSVLINFNSTLPAGTLIHVQNRTGEEIFTFAPSKQFQSIAFSSPLLVQGESYAVYLGGTSTGTQVGGLVQGGSYAPGDLYENISLNSIVTLVGSNRNGRP